MLSHGQLRIAKAYAALQAIIWAKSAAFFAVFGHGKALPFSAASFPHGALLFDFWFHSAMHVLIGVLAILFGRNTEKFDLKMIVPVVFAAVALHNIGYWLTNSHPNIVYSVMDFVTDSVILAVAIFTGHLSRRIG
ncbi:MAG: hypothetical protein HY544_05560 [Candidatus Diapherotrites archaeon]|uniref:Uncharacterized protein n=1 Tax=Candidatus Iainarchaeum sp. TaxID=3101447 RepID=A0A8T3YPL3_9ARCH|nr:hypothetical protein [Candidatus Diapherotrites archaeon]